jgi:hypothetical protein
MPYGFAAVALSTGLLLLKGSRIAPRNDRKPVINNRKPCDLGIGGAYPGISGSNGADPGNHSRTAPRWAYQEAGREYLDGAADTASTSRQDRDKTRALTRRNRIPVRSSGERRAARAAGSAVRPLRPDLLNLSQRRPQVS